MTSLNKEKSTEPDKWDKSVIAKYDVSGPRYTSYPTALHFKEDVSSPDFTKNLLPLHDSIEPVSLYIHIPFCQSICYYCACNKIVTNDKSAARQYLDYLKKEIHLRSQQIGKHRTVTQLHFGGGTPTFLDNAELTELIHNLSVHFKLIDSESREYSIEIDPRTVQDDSIALLKGLGFNRLSFGVQDFDPKVQKAINRIQSYSQIKSLVDSARSYRYKSVSFDLIYGLPFQTRSSMQATIDKVIELSPDRISYYNYAHLPERFKSQRAIDRLTLPSAEEKLDILELITNKLIQAGYVFIGMDHFAKPDDELVLAQQQGRLQRNFQGYSTCMAPDLLGLGVSSISSLLNTYSQNEKDLVQYYRLLDEDRFPDCNGIVLTHDDEMRRFIIKQIICNLELNIKEVEDAFKIEFAKYFDDVLPKLTRMEADGLIETNDNGFQVKERGRLLLRNICMLFDNYLAENSSQRYSKTI